MSNNSMVMGSVIAAAADLHEFDLTLLVGGGWIPAPEDQVDGEFIWAEAALEKVFAGIANFRSSIHAAEIAGEEVISRVMKKGPKG